MNHTVFAQLGLLTAPGFLSAAQCDELRTAMIAAESEAAGVTQGQYSFVDENTRRAKLTELAQPKRLLVRELLFALLPKLENHFGVTLQGFEKPNYLIYAPGCFFKQHRDSADDPAAVDNIAERKISVVIFLNPEMEQPTAHSYRGGKLVLYSLLDDPRWNCGFPLTGEEGLLIAFRSEQQHEVTPVLAGHRFTIATWFY